MYVNQYFGFKYASANFKRKSGMNLLKISGSLQRTYFACMTQFPMSDNPIICL